MILTSKRHPADLLAEMNRQQRKRLVKELVDYLGEVAPRAMIRYGDYPRGEPSVKTTLILSQLNSVDKIVEYYDKIPKLTQEKEQMQEEDEIKLNKIVKASRMVPSLFREDGN